MKLYRTLLAACAALMVLPAVASAQSSVPPPGGDNIGDAIPVRPQNSSFLPLTPGVLGFSADTTNYTTEAGEFDACGNSTYGKTIWSLFAVNRTGRIDITAAGYDSVLALLPLSRTGVPQSGPCTDRLAGRIESFPRDNLPTVKKGNVYAVQVGGFRGADGNFAGGPLEVDFELLPPENVQGDAILTWRSARGGVRITSIRVSGPRGSQAVISCARRSCGRRQTVRNPKAVGVFAKATVGNRPLSGDKYQPAKVSDKPIRMATTSVFRGRTIRNGTRLIVRVEAQNDDQIGQVFFWDVRGNAAGAKSLGCVNPGSTRMRRVGTCTGA
jgi:hypothetical protein